MFLDVNLPHEPEEISDNTGWIKDLKAAFRRSPPVIHQMSSARSSQPTSPGTTMAEVRSRFEPTGVTIMSFHSVSPASNLVVRVSNGVADYSRIPREV